MSHPRGDGMIAIEGGPFFSFCVVPWWFVPRAASRADRVQNGRQRTAAGVLPFTQPTSMLPQPGDRKIARAGLLRYRLGPAPRRAALIEFRLDR